MRIIFTKLTDERHRLAIERDDGSREEAELETRSFLLHDLVHHAVESVAGIEDGFWGLLARGTTLDALADRTMENPISKGFSAQAESAQGARQGIALAERLVGPMQSVWNGRLDRARYIEVANLDFVDDAFVDRVHERLRALVGHWRATKVRESMIIHWP